MLVSQKIKINNKLCVYLESNQGPLSYQDSVLPLNYTRICKQFIYFYFWWTTHLYGYIRTAFYHSTIHACVNNLFIFIWDNNLFRSVKLWATRRIVPQKRLARATAKSLWAKFLAKNFAYSFVEAILCVAFSCVASRKRLLFQKTLRSATGASIGILEH